MVELYRALAVDSLKLKATVLHRGTPPPPTLENTQKPRAEDTIASYETRDATRLAGLCASQSTTPPMRGRGQIAGDERASENQSNKQARSRK